MVIARPERPKQSQQFLLLPFYFLLSSAAALCQVIIGKFLLKTKDDTISGLGFQGIWLYAPKKTIGLNILWQRNIPAT